LEASGKLRALDGLESLTSLSALSVGSSAVADLAPLTGLGLTRLWAQKTKLRSLAGLSRSSALVELSVHDCPSLRALPALAGLTKLQRLALSRNSKLRTLEVLRGLTGLEVLGAAGTGLDDDDLIDALPKLKEAWIAETPVAARAPVIARWKKTLAARGGKLHL